VVAPKVAAASKPLFCDRRDIIKANFPCKIFDYCSIHGQSAMFPRIYMCSYIYNYSIPSKFFWNQV